MALDEWHPEPDGDAPFPYGKTRESGSSGFKTRKQGMSFSIKADSGSLVSTLLLTQQTNKRSATTTKNLTLRKYTGFSLRLEPMYRYLRTQ